MDASDPQHDCTDFGMRPRSAVREWAGILLMAAAATGLLFVLALWTDSIGTIVPQLQRGATPVGLFLFAAAAFAASLVVGGTLAWGEAYLATLWALSPLLPGVASLGIIVIYLATGSTSSVHHEAEFTGTVVAVGMWLICGGLLRMLATAPTAQVRSYGELLQRTRSLMARVGHRTSRIPTDDIHEPAPAGHDSTPRVPFRREIHADLEILGCELGLYGGEPGAGLRFVSASGYMTLWRTLHQAEATALETDDQDRVVAAAIYDYLRLYKSQIPNRDVLCSDLRAAVAELDQSALRYLEFPTDSEAAGGSKAAGSKITTPSTPAPTSPSTPSATDATATTPAAGVAGAVVAIIAAMVMKVMTWLAILTGPAQVPADPKPAEDPVGTEATARAVIKTVRMSVNEYRNGRWDELIRARNRLLRTILLGATAGYVLTVVAIVGKADAKAVAAATAFYFVGGAVGLVARLRAEGRSDSAVDDYGLFEARLLHIPLLGGLAAVFGVVLVAFGAKAALGSGDTTTELATIFNVTDVRGLVTAAAFGLAPNLLIAGLNDNVSSIKKSLASSQAAGDSEDASDQAPK